MALSFCSFKEESEKGLLDNDYSQSIEVKRLPGMTQEHSTSFREARKPMPILGHFSLRFMGFLGASTAAVLALINIWQIALTRPWDLLDTILLFMFSFATAIIETTSFVSLSCCGCCVRLRFKIEFWAKFLSRAWGKFIVYALIASLLLTWHADLFWIITGIFNTIVGVAYFFYSIYGSRKLKGVKREALKLYKDHFEDLFDEVDVNGDGYLNPYEMDLLADKLGLTLSANEIQVMLNYLDTDRDGKISIKEFKIWFEENKLPTLV